SRPARGGPGGGLREGRAAPGRPRIGARDPGGLALLPGRARSLLGVVEDDAQRVARARPQPAHAVADVDAIEATGPARGPDPVGEDDEIALAAHDRLPHRLRARALLYEQELATLVILAGTAQEEDDLEGKPHRAVHVLVQAVVAAGLVVQQQGRGLRLSGLRAAGQERIERGREALARTEGLRPAVGHAGQARVGRGA